MTVGAMAPLEDLDPGPAPAALGRRARLLCALLVLVLGSAARLPWLTGPHVVLDGDEAILTLMARDLAAGESFPLFFYGQRYGFSIVEAAAAALACGLFGFSVLAIKAAMLALWLPGAFFLALAVGRRVGERGMWLAAVLISLLPAWGVWALKARGGYVTAFVLVHGTLAWLWWRPAREQRSNAWLALLGALSGLVLVAQFIWALVLCPFVLAFLLERRRARDLLPVVLGGAATLALVLVPGWLSTSGYWKPSLFNAPDLATAIARAPGNMRAMFSGAFYLQDAVRSSAFDLAALLWCLAFAAALAAGLLRFVRQPRAWNAPAVCALIGGGAVFALSVPTSTPRYTLPLADLAVLLVALELGRVPWKRLALAATAVLAASGTWAALEFRQLAFAGRVQALVPSESAALEALLAELEARGVQHVYCVDNLLQWIVTATSDEAVIARWTAAVDRVPAYIAAVDAALDAGRPTAVVGYAFQAQAIEGRLGPGAAVGIEVAQRYVIYPAPTREQLVLLGFEFGAEN